MSEDNPVSLLLVDDHTENLLALEATLADDARRVRAVIVLVESWPGPDRGVYDDSGRKMEDFEIPSHLRRPTEEPDLAVGRRSGREGGNSGLPA